MQRPGMYTETERPNHLAQEVIDNSVDEAVAGHATTINVMLYKITNNLIVVDPKLYLTPQPYLSTRNNNPLQY
jgi:DNA gyrase/topoisomerase IV subunit B